MIKVNEALVEISENREGSDVCEFYIQSKALARIISRLIENCDTDFDADYGRMLTVNKDIVHGIACGRGLTQLTDLLPTLDEALYYILNDEDDDDFEEYDECWDGEGCYYKELEDNKEIIINDIVSVKWESVCTDLSAMDFGANIDCIDDIIFSHLMEQREDEEKETFNSLKEAIEDSDFISDATEYLYAEERDLIEASCFLYKDGKEEYYSEIKNNI